MQLFSWVAAFYWQDTAGDVKLVLEAKVDVRDGLAWSSLDKYIKGLEGAGSAPATSSGPQPHAQDTDAAAAVAAAAGAAESEDEAEPGQLLMLHSFKSRFDHTGVYL